MGHCAPPEGHPTVHTSLPPADWPLQIEHAAHNMSRGALPGTRDQSSDTTTGVFRTVMNQLRRSANSGLRLGVLLLSDH